MIGIIRVICASSLEVSKSHPYGRVQLKLGLADMGQDTTGFSRVVPHFNLTPPQNRTDTIGFSRMVLQLQPSVGHILLLG